MQHRVKISFTLMGSIISLMADTVQTEDGRILLGKLGMRVRAMTEMYNLLYATEAVTEMQLNQYFAKIIASMPLPTICLLSRIFSFPENSSGAINVTLRKKEAGTALEISDNSIGLSDGFELSASNSLGLIIVQSLVKQIDDNSLTESGQGTHWFVQIPLK